MNRVVITGYGAVTPLGLNVDQTWRNLISGRSGVGYITLFPPDLTEVKIAAEVKGFDPTAYMDANLAKYSDRFAHFAIVSALEAIDRAQLRIEECNEYDIGVVIGTGIGGITTLLEQVGRGLRRGYNKVSPYGIPMVIGDSAPGYISILTGIRGPNICVTSSCSTGADAIGMAYEMIKSGKVQVAIAGGADAAITPFGIAGFTQAGALSRSNKSPEKVSRPFDRDRSGFVMGEGGAVVVLENYAFAVSRAADIIAEVVGYGATSDAHHITQPLPDGTAAAKAIELALGGETRVDYISAHGTSTYYNDIAETRAIKNYFGDKRIPVSSIKSMVGHMLGAAGALEVIVCCKVVEQGVIPPTINLDNPDPECDLDYVPNKARARTVELAISNSFGFGGHNSVLAIKRFKER